MSTPKIQRLLGVRAYCLAERLQADWGRQRPLVSVLPEDVIAGAGLTKKDLSGDAVPVPTPGDRDGVTWLSRNYAVGVDDGTGEVFVESLGAFYERTLNNYLAPGKTLAQLKSVVDRRGPLPWIWDGVLLPGETALLTALPKTGKSTLLFDLCEQITAGHGEFFGRKIRRANILYFSEEGDESVVEKAEARPALLYSPHFRAIPRPAGMPVAELSQEIDKALVDFPELPGTGMGEPLPLLIVVDTVRRFFKIDELDQRQQDAAMEILKQRLDANKGPTGLSLLLVHHSTKQSGSGSRKRFPNPVLDASGTNDWAGNVETVVGMSAPYGFASPKRRMAFIGRHKATPLPTELWKLWYNGETGRYEFDGTLDDEGEDEDGDVLARQLRDANIIRLKAEGFSLRDIGAQVKVGKDTVRKVLKTAGVDNGVDSE